MPTRIRRALLIFPSTTTSKAIRHVNPMPPLGLGYLAGVLREMQVEVSLLDALVHGWTREAEVDAATVRVGLSEHEFAGRIDAFGPDLIGIGCPFS